MEHELVERYIYAVTRRLPPKMRSDVALELEGLAADMLEQRCGGQAPGEADVRAVLEELGRPGDLAAEYDPGQKRYLVGPRYYSFYKTILYIVLPCVAFGMAVAGVVSLLGAPVAQPWYAVALEWAGNILGGLVFGFAYVTVLFAIFERCNLPVEDAALDLDTLPELPKPAEVVRLWEPIAGMAVSVAFVLVFIAFPRVMGWWFEGAWVPVFRPEVLRGRWAVVLALAALGIVYEAFRLYERRETARVALVGLGTDLLSIPLTLALFGGGLVNPAFPAAVQKAVPGDAQIVVTLFSHLDKLIMAAILLGLFVGVIDLTVKLVRQLRLAGSRAG